MKPDRNLFVGKTLAGGYQVQRFVGAGAFAYVYLGYDPQGAPVAVKVQYAAAEDAKKRFAREIKVLKQIPPNDYCVKYFADGETPEQFPFLVMEYVDGTTLKNTLKHKPVWAIDEACQFMAQLCDAFGGLHELGLAHRDVKPENIMLTRSWQVKLMDLGLVKDAQGLLQLFESEDILSGRDFAENLDRGVLAGTPEYMAPEQFSDPSLEDDTLSQTDTTTDVYSLGIIFYELLTGQKLFAFKPKTGNQGAYARSLLDYLKYRTKVRDDDLVRPAMVPEALWTVIARSLRSDPKLRQRNADELGTDVRRFIETGEGVQQLDEDKTSAIDLNSFLALHQAKPSAPAKARPAAPMATASSPLANQTLPLPPISGPNPAANNAGMGMGMGMGMIPGNPYLQSASLPPGYDPTPHAQPTNPYMGYGVYPQAQNNSKVWLWAILIALLVVGSAGIAVILLG